MQVDYEQIDWARRLLGLGESATLEEIRQAFRRLARRYHPDKCKESKETCEEEYKRLSLAYDLLLKYCENYRFSFREEDVKRQVWDEETYRHLKQFYDGWWGTI